MTSHPSPVCPECDGSGESDRIDYNVPSRRVLRCPDCRGSGIRPGVAQRAIDAINGIGTVTLEWEYAKEGGIWLSVTVDGSPDMRVELDYRGLCVLAKDAVNIMHSRLTFPESTTEEGQ